MFVWLSNETINGTYKRSILTPNLKKKRYNHVNNNFTFRHKVNK